MFTAGIPPTRCTLTFPKRWEVQFLAITLHVLSTLPQCCWFYRRRELPLRDVAWRQLRGSGRVPSLKGGRFKLSAKARPRNEAESERQVGLPLLLLLLLLGLVPSLRDCRQDGQCQVAAHESISLIEP
jgi:hypothetical protein